MRIRLGGKGYAPDLASPLNQHTKGLGDLIDLIHNLQTVAEEQPDIRSVNIRLPNSQNKHKYLLKIKTEFDFLLSYVLNPVLFHNFDSGTIFRCCKLYCSF